MKQPDKEENKNNFKSELNKSINAEHGQTEDKEEMLLQLRKMLETDETSSKEKFQIVIFKKGVPFGLYEAKSFLLGGLMRDSSYYCECDGSFLDLGFLHSYLNYENFFMFDSNASNKEK